jgi:hypothetical protein
VLEAAGEMPAAEIAESDPIMLAAPKSTFPSQWVQQTRAVERRALRPSRPRASKNGFSISAQHSIFPLRGKVGLAFGRVKVGLAFGRVHG